ncbi:MAG: hypothetical protein WCA77_10170 [Thermoplasmata archaeon]
MSGRPPSTSAPPTLRVEILKELQQLVDNRESRDRLDHGPLEETKGREHWVLHLLLRADEISQGHIDQLIGSAYSNLLARFEAVNDRLERLESLENSVTTDVRTRLDALDSGVGRRVEEGLAEQGTALGERLIQALNHNLDVKWKPIGDSIETFAEGARRMQRDVADTYRLATQTRLLLNDNARRIIDLGRDIVALEESLKLVVQKTIEEALLPLEQRVATLEQHLGTAQPNGGPTRSDPESSSPSSEPADG